MKIFLALPLALSLATCGGETRPAVIGKTGDDSKSAGADPKTGELAEATTRPLDLPKLGLKAVGPAESAAGDVVGGGTGHLVQGPGLVVSVELATDTHPKTLADDKKESEMYTPRNARDEALADGWVHTFENQGDAGKNYHVHVRRELDGKSIWCSAMVDDQAKADNALAFCKSLKK